MTQAEVITNKREILTAQCPAPLQLTDSSKAELPIDVEKAGTEGPRIVIIHGGVQGNAGGGPATFVKQKALGEQGWRVEIVDRPGFGQSPSRGVDDMEADSVWIAELLGDGAHLVGHSWGGAEVLLAAARRPKAVLSLTLVEPALQALTLPKPGEPTRPGQAATMMKDMAEMLLSSETPAEYIRKFLAYLGPTDKLGMLTDQAASVLGCSMLQARMADPRTLHEAVNAVVMAGIPVLVISGGWKAAMDDVCAFVARLMHGEHVIVASPNHYPQLENATEFNKRLQIVLGKVEAALVPQRVVSAS